MTASLDRLLAQLSVLSPQEKGSQFELVVRWLMRSEPEYAKTVRDVWLWRDWPNAPRRQDLGIDLVAETSEGERWAIQAKAYSADASIALGDLDAFLRASASGFAGRLIFATTDRLSANAETVLAEQTIPTRFRGLAELSNLEVEWPASLGHLVPRLLGPLVPREDQLAAIHAAVDELRENPRALVIMPCGIGKTLVGHAVAEDLGASRVIVTMPTLALVSQTIAAYARQTRGNFRALAFCSERPGRRSDIGDLVRGLSVPGTTSEAGLLAFLRDPRGGVVFTTYASTPTVARAMRVDGALAFDLAIVDEAHRTVGYCDAAFASILSDSVIPCRRRLFLTATPRLSSIVERVGGLGTGRVDPDPSLVSMDDPETYGRCVYQLSFKEAVRRGLLVDFRIVVIFVDQDEIVELIAGDSPFVTVDGKTVTDQRTVLQQIALARAIRDYALGSVLSFHATRKAAAHFARTFPTLLDALPCDDRPAGQIRSEYVDGETPAFERRGLFDALGRATVDNPMILANIRVAAEGVDVPELDGILFAEPRTTRIGIVQAVGRVMRKGSGRKRIGTIVVAALVDPRKPRRNLLGDSAYRIMLETLDAIRTSEGAIEGGLDPQRYSPRERDAVLERLDVIVPKGWDREACLRAVTLEIFGPGWIVDPVAEAVAKLIRESLSAGVAHLRGIADGSPLLRRPAAAKLSHEQQGLRRLHRHYKGRGVPLRWLGDRNAIGIRTVDLYKLALLRPDGAIPARRGGITRALAGAGMLFPRKSRDAGHYTERVRIRRRRTRLLVIPAAYIWPDLFGPDAARARKLSVGALLDRARNRLQLPKRATMRDVLEAAALGSQSGSSNGEVVAEIVRGVAT